MTPTADIRTRLQAAAGDRLVHEMGRKLLLDADAEIAKLRQRLGLELAK